MLDMLLIMLFKYTFLQIFYVFDREISERIKWKSPKVLWIFKFLFVVLDFCLTEFEVIFLDTFILMIVLSV